jgi:hypothetical protein
MSIRHASAAALAVPLFLTLLASGDGPKPAPAPAEKGRDVRAEDALTSLNDASRAAYRRGRDEALARVGPVVLVEGDELVLAYGLYRSTARVTPESYRTLKAIGHIPLAVHALLDGRGDEALDDKRLYDLKQYRDLVARAADDLASRGLSDEQLKRQKAVTDESLALLSGVIESRRAPGTKLDDYRGRMRPLLEANAKQAAHGQIDALHRQVKAWKGRLTDAEWGQLRVVVMGTQLPRKDNLAVQYFARLLGEAGEGGRVVYAEALFDESKALDLLATRVVDTRIGTAFFGDAARMHRDLLGDAAREYLDELFPKGKP